MGLFKGLFGKKEPQKPVQKPMVKAFDITEGLYYTEVREREDSREKWTLMMAFANKGDEIALYDVGLEYLTGKGMVQRDDANAEKYLLQAREKGMNQASVSLGQMWLRCSVDVYDQMGADTAENRAKADAEFDRRFQLGADYLVEALEGRRPADTELVCKMICGNMRLGYNEGKIRDFFLECINKNLPGAVERIQALTDSEDTYVAASAWYKLGCFYLYGVHFEDDLDEAKACFEKCVKIDPYHADGCIALSNPLFEDD